ncbi:hypothetical protein PCANC_09942 [Puccinia coronata f. sp. avenae]|uniref:Uncharacterized protein n=1 Tax=Puccinia coronata f. sp. avenae TaxID=200324 RepID=A0A2N5V2U7_9BASI|nr:hypothetical protein PCANC_09942 [Puccinia coronata f. sp. avenae]
MRAWWFLIASGHHGPRRRSAGAGRARPRRQLPEVRTTTLAGCPQYKPHILDTTATTDHDHYDYDHDHEHWARDGRETIARSSVLVYSKSYCPHSQRAKKILREVLQSASANDHDNHDGGAGEEEEGTVEILQVVELDELGGRGVQIQTYLAELTHQRTVPNIFIHQKHIGGADDLTEIYQTGQLPGLIFDVPRTTTGSPDQRTRSFHSRLFTYPGTKSAAHHPMVILVVVLLLAGLVYRFVILSRSSSLPDQQKKKQKL